VDEWHRLREPVTLDYDRRASRLGSSVTFRCVDGENVYSANALVFVVQAAAISVILVIAAAVVGLGLVLWFRLRRSR
jgi:hypothetical protein